MELLRRIHLTLYAMAVKWFRTRAITKSFKIAHAQELTMTPVHALPMVLARQSQELKAVKAGKIDVPITDRKSWAWPFMPSSINRLSVPLIKSSPYNLRRMSRTPVPRRAMNLIKGAVISQPWDIRPIEGEAPIVDDSDQAERIKIAKKVFSHPNNVDSFQTFIEQGLEDQCVLGAFAAELAVTIDVERPLKMWCINVESMRIFPAWTESTPEMPHYAQMTGLKGERGALLFYEDEILYIKDNPSTDNPFGLGNMEVAFQSVNDFLGVQGMAGRSGTDQIHKTFLWFEAPQNEGHIQILRRYIQNELEGQAKLSIMTGMKKPDTVEVTPVTEADLLLGWQEVLIRMIANAFDMSAMALGVEHDVNRAVGEVLDDKDFRSAVVPKAKRLQEAFTRKILHGKLGWKDLEFVFLSLDDPDAQTKMDLLARMYSTNSVSSNEIRVKMGFRKAENPLYDCNQFELMLLNAQAAVDLQSQAQAKSMQQQMSMFGPPGGGGEDPTPQIPVTPATGEQPEQAPPQQQLPPGQQPGQAKGGGQAGAGKVAGPKVAAPTAINLPKFPVAASRYTAKQLMQMPVNQMQDVWRATGLSATQFLRAVDDSEPGILQQMSDEAKQFFERLLEKESQKPISNKTLARWRKELATKVSEQNRRTADMSQWLMKIGRNTGKPGHGRDYPKLTSTDKTAGKPGMPPKVTMI